MTEIEAHISNGILVSRERLNTRINLWPESKEQSPGSDMYVASRSHYKSHKENSSPIWSVVLIVLALWGIFPPSCALAADLLDEEISLNIPANTIIEDALIEFGTKAGFMVMMSTSPETKQPIAQGIQGKLPARKALSILLRDSDLTYSVLGDRLRIFPAKHLLPTNNRTEFMTGSPSDEVVASEGNALPTSEDQQNLKLEEVVVTSEKREERLQDVPIPVTSLSADSLVETGKSQIADYFSSFPGLTISGGSGAAASSNVTIRGMYNSGGNPTTAYVVDDVPFGSSQGLGGGGSVPDLDPGDLDHIEVLRGPQGTLYGASTLGGLIKFVTRDPSTDAVSGRLQAEVSKTDNGDGPGYGVRASVNLPIASTLALRASVYARRDAGYIDDPAFNERGVNWANADGGRLALRWSPIDNFSMKLSALIQDYTLHGLAESDLAVGDLMQNILPNTGINDRTYQSYNATMQAKVGPVEITSITGYSSTKLFNVYDFGSHFSACCVEPFYNVPGVVQHERNTLSKFTEEIRAVSHFGANVDLLVGGFYTHENSPFSQELLGAESSGAIVGSAQLFSWSNIYDEYSGFTDITVHFTKQFDVQFGARESYNTQRYTETDTGPATETFFGFAPPLVFPVVTATENAFSYLFTPRYKFSEDWMAYARIASAYRPGGFNPEASAYGVPITYGSDRTSNYEIGIKGNSLNRLVSIDVSAYYTNWRNIQIAIERDNLYFEGNGATAKSDGVDATVEIRPYRGLVVSTWVSLGYAELTRDLPTGPTYGIAGDWLPFSTRISGDFSIQQDLPISERYDLTIGGDVNYVGNRYGNFLGTPERQYYGGYAKTNFHAGLKAGPWEVGFFANNIMNKRGQISGGLDDADLPTMYYYIQPRTLGLSVTRRF